MMERDAADRSVECQGATSADSAADSHTATHAAGILEAAGIRSPRKKPSSINNKEQHNGDERRQESERDHEETKKK
jgi:hypothetical protein